METIKSFEDMVIHLAQRNDRKRVAVVWAADRNSQVSVARALEIGFIEAIFVGCQAEVEANESIMRYASHVSFIPADDRDEAARISVKLVRDGGADILMKGLINTDNLLHVVLNKETGILPRGHVLTHITAARLPEYEKLLFFSEKVNEKYFPFTVGYREIVGMAERGEFGRCIIDGPLDLKTSVSPESMRIKGIKSPIGGDADALIFPDIEAANVFYKSITLFLGVETAGVLQGTMAPVVLPSRSDSKLCKFYSLALAAI